MRGWSTWGSVLGVTRHRRPRPKSRRKLARLSRAEPLESRLLLTADLAVTMSAPATVLAGDLLTYDITVTDHGNDSAQNLLLSDKLPDGVTFVSASSSPLGRFDQQTPPQGSTGTVRFDAAGLSPLNAIHAQIVVRVSADLSDGTVLANAAQVTSDTPDATPDDDSASVSTTVHPPAVLIAGKTYLDANADGIHQSGEPAYTLSQVYIDLNNNGRLDPGEPTSIPDQNGNYQFALAAPGTYTVREAFEPEADFEITGPASGSYTVEGVQGSRFTNLDFGDVPSDRVMPVFAAADRFGPAHDVDTAIVNGVYRNILGRDPDPAGLAFFEQALAAGMNRDQLARDVWNSTEHRIEEVDFYYSTYLHRTADLGGLDFWVTALEVSGNEIPVVVGIVTSPEYHAAHPSDQAWVTALYNDILGIAPDTDGLAHWVAALQQGTPRVSVAEVIATSERSAHAISDSLLFSYFHGAEVSFNLNIIDAVVMDRETLEDIIAAIVSSEDYLAEAGTAITAAPRTD